MVAIDTLHNISNCTGNPRDFGAVEDWSVILCWRLTKLNFKNAGSVYTSSEEENVDIVLEKWHMHIDWLSLLWISHILLHLSTQW